MLELRPFFSPAKVFDIGPAFDEKPYPVFDESDFRARWNKSREIRDRMEERGRRDSVAEKDVGKTSFLDEKNVVVERIDGKTGDSVEKKRW